MSQQSLFGNIEVKQPKKKTNKELLGKINAPKKVRKVRMTVSIEDVYRNVERLSNKLKQARPNTTFELITTQERLKQYIGTIRKNGTVAFDTETSGLDEHLDFVCGVCLYTVGENPVYVPTNHDNYEHNLDITELVELLESGDIKADLGNAKFDIRVIKNTYNRETFIPVYWDVILAGKVLNENEKSHALKFLHDKYIFDIPEHEIEPDSYKKIFGNWKFNQLDPRKVFVYGAADGLKTFEVAEFQRPFLEVNNPVCQQQGLQDTATMYREVEMDCNEPVAAKENRGVNIDTDFGKKLEVEFDGYYQDALNTFNSVVHSLNAEINVLKEVNYDSYLKITPTINPHSPQQLGILFYDVLKLQNKEQNRGTGEPVIDFLIKQYPQYKKLFDAILVCRKYKKLIGTYVKAIPEQVNAKTGRLHAKFHQYGTVTGRFSSSDPNLQNIPGEGNIRGMFIPTAGYYLIGSDYSQQEPRILAHVAGDENMKQAYIDGLDLYAEVASRVFNKPYNECVEFNPETGATQPEGKKRRKIMKDIMLSIMYGKGVNNVAQGLKISKQEAQKIFDKFYADFPKVKEFMDNTLANAKKTGYVKTVWGRKRRLPDLWLSPYTFSQLDNNNKPIKNSTVPNNIQSYCISELKKEWGFKKTRRRIELEKQYGIRIVDNGGFIADAERQTVNSIVQGTAADMTKRALILIYNDPIMKQLGFHTLMAVHDEIIGEAPKHNALKALKRLEELMKQAGAEKISVPMKCDGEIMERWGGKDIKENI